MRGVADMIEFGFPDAGPWSVMMHYEAHRNHQRAGSAAAEAQIADHSSDWKLRAVGFFFTKSPNIYFDAGAWREKKHRALAPQASLHILPDVVALATKGTTS